MKTTDSPALKKGSQELAYPLIGVGFSAGGLDAFKHFLRGINPDSNGAYVVVQHIPEDTESQLFEIIESTAPLPVLQLKEGAVVESGKIYVLRASAEVSIREGVFHLLSATDQQIRRNSPIDHFFGSLARDKAEMVVGVILSGTGTDGTIGLQKIKAAGGICLVQDPEEAKYSGMPESAIATGCIDFVGSADELAARADRTFTRRGRNHITSDSLDSEKEATLFRMLCLVRARTGNDFRSYKRRSILRRIERRMSIVDISDFNDYLEYLRQHNKEIRDLARDILISVTCFFRDPAVWQALEEDVVPEIIETKHNGDDIRVWVPGCATGEEAYSFGIIFSEAIERSGKSIGLQIYATDIDDYSRGIARAATYPAAIVDEVGETYANKYFEPDGPDRFSIIEALREKVVFARQNILTDPPFSRMDLVSCRNLLIYLNTQMQKRLINLLHFSLNEGGIAVLGSAESTGQSENLFKPLHRELRIFKRTGEHSIYPNSSRNMLPPVRGKPVETFLTPNIRPRSRSIEETSRNLIMEHFDAASVLVDEKLHIRYLSGQTKRYLHHPEGTPSNDLSVLVNASVGHKIRNFAKQVLANNKPHSFLADLTYATTRRTRVTLKPIRLEDGEDGLFIIFESVPDAAELLDETATVAKGISEGSEDKEKLISDMDRELKDTQSELRSIVEDLSSANEELKSSNEEVMSMNEELQSSNEELETSKEELQSLNDELSNVNKKLSSKVTELEATNNDLHNLLTSTEIATIFLDEKLRIKRFTAACSRLFNLIPSDLDRPIADLASKFNGSNLIELCGKVLEDLKSREDEIQSIDETHYLRRIMPYRTKDNRIEGVVVTFNDVSLLKRAETELVEAERCLRLAIQNSPIIIFAQNCDLEYTYILNQPIAYPAQEVLGKTDRDIFPEDYQELESLKKEVLKTGEILRRQISIRMRPDNTTWTDLTLEPLKDKNGRINGVTGAAIDITEQVDREGELEAASEAKTRFLSSMSHDIRTPLTAIMGLAELLEEILDRDHQEIGEEIKNSCRHLISTLDSVLNLAHLQGGEVKLSLEPIHLKEILEDVRDNFDPVRKQNNGEPRIRIVMEDEDLHVIAEYGALLRVLGNLVGNALKFCPDAPITLRTSRKSDQATIQVEDRGPGIAEDFIKDLFKPFTQQSGSQQSSLPGSGLGLSISQELVQLMDGSIDVESTPGKGTTMRVRLPVYQEENMPAIMEAPQPEVFGRISESRTVICDDHEATCKVIRRLLRDHDVAVVSNEEELFEQLDGADVLLLDINLHGRNRGIEIMKKLRAEGKYKDLHIIAFTAHALPRQKESFIEEGFDDYLSKPFRKQDLIDKINQGHKST